MDRTHFNKLTPAQAERLALLAEECGEVIQVIGKILRHGYESTNPTISSGGTNRELLEKELGDVQAAVYLLNKAKDIDYLNLNTHEDAKLSRVSKYFHHNLYDAEKDALSEY